MHEFNIHNIMIDGLNPRPSMYVGIRDGDWDYPRYMSDIAANIVSDWKFDNQCQTFRRNRDFLKRNKREGE